MKYQQDADRKLSYLNEIGIALSSEQNLDRLFERILLAAKTITGADGGSLYLFNPERKTLRFVVMRTDSLGLAKGGTSGKPISFMEIPLYLEDGSANHTMLVSHVALTGQAINIEDAYTAEGFDFSGTRAFDQKTGYRSRSFLTIPMKNHLSEVIGVLQLINAIDPASGRIVAFSQASEQFAYSLASQAAVSLSNRQLIHQLAELFESFIRMINQAIDEKSPYTGGHCQRVPELTMLLAEAAHAAKDGPFADFEMTEKDRYELKIAGLMHDCGKVTTPVHVIDKATKLQTIFDRIELIDTRFEVVKRDVHVAYLEACAAGEDPRVAQARRAEKMAQIEADKRFVHFANVGSEAMRPEDVDRLSEISARYHWRKEDGDPEPFFSEDELENLSIRAGTLTAAEREVINHHIVSTIRMLESLPWPSHLHRVPEFAGGHHERMDGKGYPRGLTRDQMSVQARMMGIADIFEALTASDRPYKPPMSLSESLRIMAKFSANGHIDPELFDLFVHSRVWKEYADRFLQLSQIDAVDIDAVMQMARG